jgi:NTP pyrophosphatase (non-canonical NTP hydrolase)
MKHSELVKKLVKPGAKIVAELTPADTNLLHMAVGISGEAGELLDAVKKAVIYRKPLDFENVIEELGDLEFYMEGLRQEIGVSRDETLKANIEKLSKRYEKMTYTDEHAQTRLDKQ